jgi:HK97 family phage portal protein
MAGIKDFARAQAEGKAIPNHRFFADDAPLSFYTPGAAPQRERGVISQREAKHHLQAYGGSEAMDWVMDCISLYCEPTGTAPWHLEKDGKKYATERTMDNEDLPLADQSLVRILKQPNPMMDYGELIELLVIDLFLVGNAYWYKYQPNGEGRPFQLWRLSPSDVRIKPAKSPGIERYEYSPQGVEKPMFIPPEQVIHFKRPNPHSPYYGLGIIKGAGRAADIDLAITDSQAWYFENKADPSLIVESERRVPRDVFRKLRAQLRARTAGTHNAGELLVLEAGLKAKALSPSARDAMYKDLSDTSRDRVLAWFKVNPKLLGIAEVGTAGDKVQDARREFDNKQLRPFMDKLQTKVTAALADLWGYQFVIDHRYVMPQEDAVKLSGDFAAIPGVKVREVRSFLVEAGILSSETTGDDEIDEMVLNLPGEELDEDGQGGFADRPLPGEPGRPPKGENTKRFPRGTKARSTKALRGRTPKTLEEITAELEQIRRAEEGKAVELEDAPGTTSIGRKLRNEQRPADVLVDVRHRDVDAIVDAMRDDVLSAMHVLERGLLDHVEGKAFEPKSLVKRVRNSDSWKSFATLLSVALERGAQQSVSAAAVHHAEAGTLPEDELDYAEIAASVINRPEGVRGITKNLKDEIVQKVAQAVEDGRSREEVDGLIRESVDFWREHKAETVALTEATEAYNEGSLTVMESAGDNEVYVEDGDEHDEPCKLANGSVWPIDYARQHRIEHPRCRRAFLRLVPEVG